MVSSGYATEVTYESIWDTTIATARFDNLNVRIGGILNGIITGDDDTDITASTVLVRLAHMTEILIIEIESLSKIGSTTNPWDFMRVLDPVRITNRFQTWIDEIKTTLGENKMELVTKELPGVTERTY